MSTLGDIRKRIQGINTTSKITQAMKLVATARIQRQKAAFLEMSKFVSNLYILLKNLSKNVDFAEVFDMKDVKSEDNLYVVITSTLGLCGPYNINICHTLLNALKPNDKIIVVGERGFDYLRAKGLGQQIIYRYIVGTSSSDYIDIAPLAGMIIAEFEKRRYKSVHIIYTKYCNSLKFEPIDLQILPFDQLLFNPEAKDHHYQQEIEVNEHNQIIETLGSRSRIIKDFIPFIFGTVLTSAIAESKLCEYSSRRNAMEAATDNAKDIIENLKQKYNQVRQEKITQEINEIVAGSGGTKG
ncbi:MAG: ATP synthase F1 subunit gamma [Malacoplasma sp.]|nr:ATP synthase F1 subunit gamma [Malacoplasma sp.]